MSTSYDEGANACPPVMIRGPNACPPVMMRDLMHVHQL